MPTRKAEAEWKGNLAQGGGRLKVGSGAFDGPFSTTMNEILYLDDLHVGQRFASASHPIDEHQIIAFAREFDPQPFHLDAETAKGTLFGGLAASGWHTAAITMRLNVGGGLPIAGGIVGLGGELAWPKPVRPGDVLHVESEVVEVAPSRSRPDRGTVTVRSETRNQRGEVVQVATMKLLVPRRPTSGAPLRESDAKTR
jgi:acyl dehydratase